MKDTKKSDKDGKSTTNGGDSREEPQAKLSSDIRTETGGERIKERERDRERERTRGRDHDRGRDSDRERGRDERDDYERGRDKVRERVHRSRDKGKDSGEHYFSYLIYICSSQIAVYSFISTLFNFLTDLITQDAWISPNIILLEVFLLVPFHVLLYLCVIIQAKC